jgi:hypothetical protein
MSIAVVCFTLSACFNDVGVNRKSLSGQEQGRFRGIEAVEVLSPSAVRLSWNSSSQYSGYRIFSSSSPSTSLDYVIFPGYTLTGLQPDTEYSFSIGAVENASSADMRGHREWKTARTWPKFEGVLGAAPNSEQTLDVHWEYPYKGVSFRVYVEESDSISSFDQPVMTTDDQNAGIRELNGGVPLRPNTEYSVYVRAVYLDGSFDSNEKIITIKTPSTIPQLPVIETDLVLIGSVPRLKVSNALPEMTTSFFKSGTLIGSVKGNGTLTPPTIHALSPGKNVIQIKVSYQGEVLDLEPIEIVSRGLNEKMRDFPAFEGGRGPQRLGSPYYQNASSIYSNNQTMVSGDFNCDGILDLAVAAPNGLFDPYVVNSNGGGGGVYVFYGTPYQSPLLPGGLDLENPQLITRPKLTGLSNTDNGFGTAMAAGNLNAHQVSGNDCDDLAISTYRTNTTSTRGEVWVFFGSENGLQTGGTPVSNGPACASGNCSPLRLWPDYGAIPAIDRSCVANTSFGSSLSIGRLHSGADSYRDLLIGASQYNVNQSGCPTGANRFGAAFIFYGGGNGLQMEAGFPKYSLIGAPIGSFRNTNTQGNYHGFGYSVLAANLDSPNDQPDDLIHQVDDIIIGSPVDGYLGGIGVVYYYSSRHLGVDSVTYTHYPKNPVPTAVIQDPVNNGLTFFGGTLANAGDINLDGYDDIIITRGKDVTTTTRNDNSRALVLYGGGYEDLGVGKIGPQLPLDGGGNLVCVTSASQAQGSCASSGTSCEVLGDGEPGPAACTPLVLTYGETVGNSWGVQVAGASTSGASDVNGDGYADVLVGWSVNGANKSEARLHYGSPTGLSASYSRIKPLVSGPFDNLGLGVSMGDFNGNGFSDVAVAAPDDQSFAGNQGGVVYLMRGKEGGLSPQVNHYDALIAENQSFERYSSASGYLAHAKPVGDLNGDGYTDVIAMFIRPPKILTSNYVYTPHYDLVVYYGSSGGLITHDEDGKSLLPSLSPANSLHPTFIPSANDAAPNFRWFSPAGDVNGDGYSDIVAGGAGASDPIYLYHGSPSGLQTLIQPQAPPVSGLDPIIIASNHQRGPNFERGFAIATHQNPAVTFGDFNGDGYSDLAFGSRVNQKVLVVFGSADGLQTDGVLAWSTSDFVVAASPCTGTVPSLSCLAQELEPSGAATGNFGASIANVGDINGNGYDDLVVGAPAAAADDGAAYVFHGSAQGLKLHGGTGSGILILPPGFTSSTERMFGTAVAGLGDVNGDGYADFIIASYHHSAENFRNGAGFLFYGKPNGTGVSGIESSGVRPSTDDFALMTDTKSCDGAGCKPLLMTINRSKLATGLGGTPQTSSLGWFDGIVAVGDLNGDGFSDVLIRSHNPSVSLPCSSAACQTPNETHKASVIFFGSQSGLVTDMNYSRTSACLSGKCNPLAILPRIQGWGVTQSSFFEFSQMTDRRQNMHVDFNGDGYPDFLINSRSYVNPGSGAAHTGGFYVFE